MKLLWRPLDEYFMLLLAIALTFLSVPPRLGVGFDVMRWNFHFHSLARFVRFMAALFSSLLDSFIPERSHGDGV